MLPGDKFGVDIEGKQGYYVVETTFVNYDGNENGLQGVLMLTTLTKTYLINFAYVLLRALVYAIAAFVAWRIFDKLEKLDIRTEIAEHHNLGLAIIIAALFLGLAYVIGQI